jgi:hypothetical protein
MYLLLLASLAFAQNLYATQATSGVRWPGEKGVSLTLKEGEEVEVVAENADKTLVRVRKGTDFGWVDATLLSAQAPGDLGGLLDVDLGASREEPAPAAEPAPEKKPEDTKPEGKKAAKKGKGKAKSNKKDE